MVSDPEVVVRQPVVDGLGGLRAHIGAAIAELTR
jgi:hypothetical protein